MYFLKLHKLEDRACYTGLLLAPAEGFVPQPRLFLTKKVKKIHKNPKNPKNFKNCQKIRKSGKISKKLLKKSLKKKKIEERKNVDEEKNGILLVFQYQEDAIRQELSSPARFRNQWG